MRTEYAILIAYSLSLIQCVGGMAYNLKKQWQGDDFLSDDWYFSPGDHPTVMWITRAGKTLSAKTLYMPCLVKGKKFYMHADSTNVIPSSARGRPSVRISSREYLEIL
ncbi:hypothetical protein BGW80DRAFT_1249297 [Lactifluus volemus]|nr:hypothetical protein BGW80DRAFT_1249297 [Lactifluus volemus]